MGLTLQQLQQMGAKPGVSMPSAQNQPTPTPTTAPQQPPQTPATPAPTQGRGVSLQQLQQMGAKPGVTPPQVQTNEEEQATAQPEKHLGNLPTGNPREVLGATWDTLKGAVNPMTYAKFIKSAVAAPVDIVRGLMGKDPITAGEGPGGISTFQSDFAKKTVPEVMSGETSPLAATAGTVADVVGSGAGFLGLGEATGLGKVPLAQAAKGNFVGKGLLQEGKAALAERSAVKTAEKAVQPRLTAKVAESSTTRKTPIRGLIERVPTKQEGDMASAVKGIVKGKTFSEDKELVKAALKTEAEQLESNVRGIKQPVSKSGVNTWLKNVEKPIEIKSDVTQNRKFDITKKAMDKIVSTNIDKNPNVDSLLKSRKEFDALVDREFPNLYDHENAPWRNAITSMRNALNDAIEANLPDGFGYKESLRKQSMMYRAMDNLAEKAARGQNAVQGEIGTTRLSRFADKNPKKIGLIKKGAAATALTALGGTGAAVYDRLKD